MNLSDNTGDVLTTLRTTDLQFPGFGISDVIEVDTIDIIATGDVGADLCEVVACLRFLWIHISLVADLTDEVGVAGTQFLTAISIPFAYRDGDDPGMTLQPALVALVDAELQGVVAWRTACSTCETDVPRLVVGGIDGRGADTCLY